MNDGSCKEELKAKCHYPRKWSNKNVERVESVRLLCQKESFEGPLTSGILSQTFVLDANLSKFFLWDKNFLKKRDTNGIGAQKNFSSWSPSSHNNNNNTVLISYAGAIINEHCIIQCSFMVQRNICLVKVWTLCHHARWSYHNNVTIWN